MSRKLIIGIIILVVFTPIAIIVPAMWAPLAVWQRIGTLAIIGMAWVLYCVVRTNRDMRTFTGTTGVGTGRVVLPNGRVL